MLASFADDGVSYLVMAQVFSPWQPASAAVLDAFPREAFYPPLFPLILAATGAAHDIALAYTVTALIQAACLPLVYLLAVRLLGARWSAVAATISVALLPSLWVHAKGILSEPLFSLLLLGVLLALPSGRSEADRGRPWLSGALLAVLLAALVLTRTAGLVLVAGYALWALARRERSVRERVMLAVPAAAAVLAYAAWLVVRPEDTSDNYARIIGGLIQSLLAADNPAAVLLASLARQANAIGEAWVGSLMLFWVEGRALRVTLACLVGVLALVGLARRLRAAAPDGWILVAYLVTFLLWPFNDQVTRFLLPALPVLLVYAFEAAGALLRRAARPAALGHAVLALLVASLGIPGLAFMHGRAQQDEQLARSAVWYRTPDLDEARRKAQVHLDLLADMEVIREVTAKDDRVMWYVPAYISLLADRRAVRAPEAWLPAAQYHERLVAAHPDYVFLSVFHPRDTRSDAAWQAGVAAFEGSEVVHARRGTDGAYSSVLLKPTLPAPRAARRP